jgi:hypothetical protein
VECPGPLTAFCKCVYEPFGSITCWECHNYLSDGKYFASFGEYFPVDTFSRPQGPRGLTHGPYSFAETGLRFESWSRPGCLRSVYICDVVCIGCGLATS